MANVVPLPVAHGYPLALLVGKFLDDIAAQGKSPATLSSYRSDLNQLQSFLQNQPNKSNQPIRAITPDVLRAFMKSQTNFSLATRARRQASLNTLSSPRRIDRGPRPIRL